MPLRIGAGMVGALLAGESINMVVRELWKGKDWEDVWEEMQDDPDNWVMRAATSIPWLGQFGGWTRPVADALTSNERIYRMDLGESAAEGAAAAVSDLGIQAMRSIASDDPVASRTWRTASRFMPGWRSHVGLAVNFGVEQTTGVDLINKMSPQRKRSVVDTVEAAPLQNDEDFFLEPQLKPDLPEDVSFLYPEQ
jgi:hypothetical protein